MFLRHVVTLGILGSLELFLVCVVHRLCSCQADTATCSRLFRLGTGTRVVRASLLLLRRWRVKRRMRCFPLWFGSWLFRRLRGVCCRFPLGNPRLSLIVLERLTRRLFSVQRQLQLAGNRRLRFFLGFFPLERMHVRNR